MKSIYSVLLFGAAASSLTACGNSSQFLTGMNVSVTEENSENFVNLSAEVNLGNVTIDNLQVPIYDPHTNLEIGKVGFTAGTSGKETITISLDATSMLHADPTLGSTLPNGRALPSSLGASTGEMLAIPVLNYSRVYIGGDLKSSVMIGAAFAIQSLDSVSNSVGGISANIFFAQSFSSTLSGVAGIYTSATAHENGIAVFGKYTAPTATGTSTAVSTSTSTTLAAKTQARIVDQAVIPIAASGTLGAASNTVLNDQMSTNQEQKVYSYFYGKKRKVSPH